jgi:hypothetical protein
VRWSNKPRRGTGRWGSEIGPHQEESALGVSEKGTMRTGWIGFVVALLVACDRSAPPVVVADEDVDAARPTPPAPAPSLTVDAAADAAFTLPALDDTCAKDADCGAVTDSIDGAYVCCPGCVAIMANVGWIKTMRAACASHPPATCPPLGCLMAKPYPKCVAGHCIDKK